MSSLFIIAVILVSILVPIGIFLLGFYAGKEVGISKKLFQLSREQKEEHKNSAAN